MNCENCGKNIYITTGLPPMIEFWVGPKQEILCAECHAELDKGESEKAIEKYGGEK